MVIEAHAQVLAQPGLIAFTYRWTAGSSGCARAHPAGPETETGCPLEDERRRPTVSSSCQGESEVIARAEANDAAEQRIREAVAGGLHLDQARKKYKYFELQRDEQHDT